MNADWLRPLVGPFNRVVIPLIAALLGIALAGLARRRGRLVLAASPEQALVDGWAERWARAPLAPRYPRARRALRVAAAVLVVGGLALTVLGVVAFKQALASHAIRVPRGLALFNVFFLMMVLAFGAVPVVFLAFVFHVFQKGRGQRGDRTHGTARWHPLRREWWNPREAVAAALVVRPDTPDAAEGLAPWSVQDVTFAHFTWPQLSRHMLVVGATGSGKTTSLYHHLMLSARMPWIYQDQKAELPLRDRFPERPVWGLDTRGYRSRSAVWNPMEEVRGPEDIEVLSALLFPDKGNMNDWVVRGSRMLFEAMCKRWHFGSLQEYVYLIEHTPLDRIIEKLPAGYVTALADTRSRAYYMGEILDVLRPWINTSRIAAVTFGRSTVTLDDFIARGGYVLCNEDKHLRQPVTLFWGMLLHRLRNRAGGEPRPLLLLMDEFGDAGRIPNMAQALALYRSKGVGIIAGVQSFALLEALYGETEWRAIRDGFGTQVILTANITPQLQMELSQQLGTFTMEHAQRSASLGTPIVSLSGSVATPSRTAAALVPVDQWAYWSASRAVIVRGAMGPTWWIPCPVEAQATPPGQRLLADAEEDWRLREHERIGTFGAASAVAVPVGQVLVPQAQD